MIKAGDGVVKVLHYNAFALDLSKEIARAQSWCPMDLTIAAVIRGGAGLKAEFHSQWAEQWIDGDWFSWLDDMVAWRPPAISGNRAHGDRTMVVLQRLREGGVTMSAIGREVGLTRERVRQIAAREGITAATLGVTLPPTKSASAWKAADEQRAARAAKKQARIDKIVGLRLEGLSQHEIAAAMGLAQSRIGQILISNGYRSRTRRNTRAAKAPPKPRERIAPVVCKPWQSSTPQSPEMIRAARALWNDGKAASEVAAALSTAERPVSKNAVIGMARRHDFPARVSPIRRAS
ncbi:MAG TPA: hypothetical protein VIJ52_08220 [Pseudolabrys sp.]